MLKIDGASMPDNCFRCFASHWYNYGGTEAGFQCKAIPGDSKIIPNCEGRSKRREDCPLVAEPQALQAPMYVEILVRREYAAIVKALEEAEILYEQDKRSVKKRELYQFMVAKEQAISELCNVLGIQLRNENMELIK